jgi:hypothetical protein
MLQVALHLDPFSRDVRERLAIVERRRASLTRDRARARATTQPTTNRAGAGEAGGRERRKGRQIGEGRTGGAGQGGRGDWHVEHRHGDGQEMLGARYKFSDVRFEYAVKKVWS